MILIYCSIIIPVTPMKPVLTTQTKPKPSLYQQYRSKTKSDLNCSINLLSGLNDIDQKMQQYQRLRSKRMSQSQIQSPNLKEISNGKTTGKQVNQVKYSQQKSERNFPVNLQIIEETQTNIKTGKATMVNMTSSCMVSTKTSTIPTKQTLIKPINSISKQQEQKKRRLLELKQKTKQLQQQLLIAFSSDPTKKTIINKEMAVLLKLFE